MRALIIGNKENFEVDAEEFTMEGISHRFIVHRSHDPLRDEFVATHMETSQVIGWGETADAAIQHATLRWMSVPDEVVNERLAEKRAWVAKMKKERGVAE